MVLLRLWTVNFCDNARDPVIEIKPERKLQWKDYLNSRCYRHKRDNMYIITITIYCNTRRYNPRLFRFHHLEIIVVGVWFPNNVSDIMASVCFLLDGRKKIVRTHEGSLKRPCQARRATVYDSSQTKISLSRHARDKRETLRNTVFLSVASSTNSPIGKRQIREMGHLLTMHIYRQRAHNGSTLRAGKMRFI